MIADTHGKLRESAVTALQGVDAIVHAGDVGGWRIVEALRAIAPLHAVMGNVDLPDGTLPAAIDCVLDGVRMHVSHGHELGSPTPAALVARYAADVIVFGHTHRAVVAEIGSTLVVNPGAAGPARFDLKPSVALLTLPERTARIVWL